MVRSRGAGSKEFRVLHVVREKGWWAEMFRQVVGVVIEMADLYLIMYLVHLHRTHVYLLFDRLADLS